MTQRLAGRLMLVTGASRGIGRAVASALAKEGAHVVAVARTVGGLEDLDDEIQKEGGSATLVPLNLTDFDALDRLGASLFERWGKLDGFVGNAAMLGALSPITHVKPDSWKTLIDLNLTANWRLVRSLDPLLKRSDAGRVVFVTSSVGNRPRAFWGGYAVSKAALEMLALVYAEECRTTRVRVNIVDPGAVRTRMRAEAYPGEDPATLPTPAEIAPALVELLLPSTESHGERVTIRR